MSEYFLTQNADKWVVYDDEGLVRTFDNRTEAVALLDKLLASRWVEYEGWQ